LELHKDVDVDRLAAVLAPELPDEVALATPVFLADEGVIDPLTRLEVDELHPSLAHDLLQEILDHAPVVEEAAIAEVVLSHDYFRRNSTTQVGRDGGSRLDNLEGRAQDGSCPRPRGSS
jgi:hypothetical protein